MDNFKTALKKSSIAFEKHFRGPLLEILNGNFEVVEGVTKDEMAKTLDMLAGIDIWHIHKRQGVRGVASRIQYGKSWDTFTVRKTRESGAKTEYEKRIYAMKNEFLYPVLAFQGYISNDVPLSFALTKTKDIFWMIDNGYSRLKKTGKSQIGQAEFYVVDWQRMVDNKKRIEIRYLSC